MHVSIENLSEAIRKFNVEPDKDYMKVHQLADEEARRLRHSYIGTEHQVLGLIRHGNPVLESFGVELNKARSVAEFIVGRGQRPYTPRYLTPRAKKVVELSIDEGKRLGERTLDPGLLLLALVREGQGIGAGMIEAFAVDLYEVRRSEIDRRYDLMTQASRNP